jgi:hypothetical protein
MRNGQQFCTRCLAYYCDHAQELDYEWSAGEDEDDDEQEAVEPATSDEESDEDDPPAAAPVPV